MTCLLKIWKQKDVLIATKDRMVYLLVVPVVMHGCESCTVRNQNMIAIYGDGEVLGRTETVILWSRNEEK